MKKIFAMLGISVLATNFQCFGLAGEPTDAAFSPTDKAFILSRFCTEVEHNFAFYDKLTFDWDSLCYATMNDLVDTPTDTEFVKGMQKLFAQLKDGHTYVFELNNPRCPDGWIKPFPMKTKRVGDKVFVTDVFSTMLLDSGVEPGCEILEIDGERVLDYAKNHIQPYLASSTPQWSEHGPFANFELTKDKSSKSSKILFRNRKGEKFSVDSDRNISWDLANENTTMSFKTLEGNVGLLEVRSFQDFDFDRSLFDKIYNDILKTDALIIDIRDNGGGNSSHVDYMISHFSSQPIPRGRWRSPMYIAVHGSWNYPKEWHEETPDSIAPAEGKPIYKNPVVLLVNASTFSSAENFCVTFRGGKIGKIIGTPTAGSTGNPITFKVMNTEGGGIGCSICTKHELDAKGNEFIGIGIQPDIIVEEDADAYLNNKDNVIEKALEILRPDRQ